MPIDPADFSSHEPPSRPDPRRPPQAWLVAAGVIVAGLLVVLGVIVVAALRTGETLPEVTLDDVNAAAGRWADSGPVDYDLDLEQSGVNPGVVHVEVRQREVTAMTLDGRPTREHLWDDWSVPGLFSVIRRDVEACMPKLNAIAQQQDASGQTPPIVPRGTFAARDGHPLQYHRITPNGADVKWTITKLQPR